jgi:hypothetical protein
MLFNPFRVHDFLGRRASKLSNAFGVQLIQFAHIKGCRRAVTDYEVIGNSQ